MWQEELSDAEPLPAKLGEADERTVAASTEENERETHFMHTQFIKAMEQRFLNGAL